MTHREWSPKPFFRHLTPAALADLRSWAAADLRADGSGKPWEQMYRAWVLLPASARLRLEAALLPVNDLAAPDARTRLGELAAMTWAQSPLLAESRSWSSEDLALRLFIAAPKAFLQLHQGWIVDSFEHLKEYAGRYPVAPKPSMKAKAALKDAMRGYLRNTAFGPRCHVEDFANDEKFALFVFHEDELKPTDRFNEEEELEPMWDRDIVRLAAVFHFETNVLMVKAPRKAEREQLRDLFAEHILGDPLYFYDARTTPRFSFRPLRDETFRFPPLIGSGLLGVTVRKLFVRPTEGDVKHVSLDFKAAPTLSRVHDACAKFGIDLDQDTIEGVHLRFTFEGSGRSRTRTVSLFNPNSSNLSDTPRDRIIRRHLKLWGFDANVRRSAVASAPLEATAH
jgi:hypothetical protein